MEMVSEVNLSMLRSFQDHLGPFEAIIGPKLKVVVGLSCDHSKRPQEEQKSNGDGFGSQFEDAQVILGPFGTIWDHLGQFGIIWDHLGPFGAIFASKCKIMADQSLSRKSILRH